MMQPEKVRNQPRLRLPLLAGLLLLLAVSCDTSHAASLDHAANLGHNAVVLFNSCTGNASPNEKGGHRRESGFFTSVTRHKCAFFMVGRGGEPSGCRFLFPGLANPAMCLPPRMQAGCGSNPEKETTMPSITRALSRLFPVFPVAVSTVPTQTEAYALARLLVSQGKRASVAATAHGFTVSEVKA